MGTHPIFESDFDRLTEKMLRTVSKTARITGAARAYHAKVHDHFNNPRNIGSLDKSKVNVGTGMVGAPACGDVMKLWIPRSWIRPCLRSRIRIRTPSRLRIRTRLLRWLLRIVRPWIPRSWIRSWIRPCLRIRSWIPRLRLRPRLRILRLSVQMTQVSQKPA